MNRFILGVCATGWILVAAVQAHDPVWLAAVASPENKVTIEERDGFRHISSNGLPDHETGRFPNRGNPNSISEQKLSYRVTLKPTAAEKATPIGMNPFGIALNGIVFDPSAAEFWQRDPNSGWQYEAVNGSINLGLDENNAHVQPNGSYHYHGVPTALMRKLAKGDSMVLVGYAGDGFPMYSMLGHDDPKDATSKVRKLKSSYQVRKGMRPDGPGGNFDGSFVQDWEYVAESGDLDEFNGRFGPTPEFPEGIYHYYLTDTFPYIPRQWKGTPDESFQRRRMPRGGAGRGPGGPGGPGGPPGMKGRSGRRGPPPRDRQPPEPQE